VSPLNKYAYNTYLPHQLMAMKCDSDTRVRARAHTRTHTHTHPFNGYFPGLPRWAGTRKVKPIWILLEQETVSGSGISWAMYKSAPRSRQITMPQFFTGRMPFLPPNQQCQSTEGTKCDSDNMTKIEDLSGARCRLAYGPADATATHCLLLQ